MLPSVLCFSGCSRKEQFSPKLLTLPLLLIFVMLLWQPLYWSVGDVPFVTGTNLLRTLVKKKSITKSESKKLYWSEFWLKDILLVGVLVERYSTRRSVGRKMFYSSECQSKDILQTLYCQSFLELKIFSLPAQFCPFSNKSGRDLFSKTRHNISNCLF